MHLLDVSFFHDKLLNGCHEGNLQHKKKKTYMFILFPFTRGEAPSYLRFGKGTAHPKYHRHHAERAWCFPAAPVRFSECVLIIDMWKKRHLFILSILVFICLHLCCNIIWYQHHLCLHLSSSVSSSVFILQKCWVPWMMCPKNHARVVGKL